MTEHDTAPPEGLRVLDAAELGSLIGELGARLEGVYGDRLRALYLFGSYARGEATTGSDVDVLVVLEELQNYLAEVRRAGGAIAALALEHDVSIVPVFVSEGDWMASATPFLRNVRMEGKAAA